MKLKLEGEDRERPWDDVEIIGGLAYIAFFTGWGVIGMQAMAHASPVFGNDRKNIDAGGK